MHIFIGEALIIYVKEIKIYYFKKRRIIPKEIYLKYLFDIRIHACLQLV